LEKETIALKIIESADGSHTLFHSGLNETYHSTNGALQESEHVYINAGLVPKIASGTTEISIFEVGFGTGLNAWLTYKHIQNTSVKIIYNTIEPFPLSKEIYDALNYVKAIEDDALKRFFIRLHEAEWNKLIEVAPNFMIRKIKTTLEKLKESDFDKVDLVYFDAFAPSKQAEIWLPENLQKIYDLMKKGGAMVTYCARGQVKRDLKAIGFEVETLLGPPGKKEMTRAIK